MLLIPYKILAMPVCRITVDLFAYDLQVDGAFVDCFFLSEQGFDINTHHAMPA